MSVVVRISDDDIVRQKGSLRINSTIDRRSTASFVVADLDGSASYQRGQKIAIYQTCVPPLMELLFGGVIAKPSEKRIPGNDILYHTIDCMDYHYFADKRRAAVSYALSMYEDYILADDAVETIWGVNWRAQTFTPTIEHYVTKVNLKLYRTLLPGTITVSIKAVDGVGDPTGADLCSGTTDGDTLDAAGPGSWREIDMDVPACLLANTQYAIVVRALDGDVANFVNWRKDSANIYPGGNVETSNDSGTTWVAVAHDFMFEEWGLRSAGSIVRDIFDKYLDVEGVTIGEIQSGPAVEQMIVNYQPVSMAYDSLTKYSNFIWYIDGNKQLFFVVRTTTDAPFSVVANDLLKRTTELEHQSFEYRNRQFIRAGKDVTDEQIESYTGDGATVAFALGYPVNAEPTVTVAGAPQDMGIKGIDTAEDCYWAKGDEVIVFAAAPAGAAAIVITYIGEYDIIVQVEDAPEILARQAIEGGTGIVEAVYDNPAINSKQAAMDTGVSLIEYFGVIGKQFRFGITDWGIYPGQLVPVTSAIYGLAAEELLVESINLYELAPNILMYSILGITGPATGDWTSFFGKLTETKEDILGKLSVGDDQILIILLAVPELWEDTETITEDVYACPVPGLAVFPLLTLYPC